MAWIQKFITKAQEVVTGLATRETTEDGIFKAYIPNFLYKPPYGMPRKVNLPQFRELSKNPYIFSVIKTLTDEVTTIDWNIQVKDEFNEGQDYSEKLKEITRFFDNPNGNEESFEHILRQVVTDILEIDSGVIVKVFNTQGKMLQIFSRDGGTFLKNPDIYGYIGGKADFVPPLPDGFTGVGIDIGGSPNPTQQQMIKHYNVLYRQNAAYFQYGWTAGSMPVPFGKREIVYIMQNPRSDSIYGRSPIQVLTEVILNLIYGIDFNLDYYTNNNMPEGVIQLLGAQPDQIKQFRDNFESQFRFKDSLGRKRKRFFKFPLSSAEVRFTPFQLTSKEMEVISQQQWFTKVLWMCYGVNADEMGYTEQSNRAVGETQSQIFKRKAIKPILDVLAYHINTQIVPEFFVKGKDMPDFGDVPVEFVFDTYDESDDKIKHDILEQEIRMGIKTPEMVAVELGIDINELTKQKDEAKKKEIDMAMGNEENQNTETQKTNESESKGPEKSKDEDEEDNGPEEKAEKVPNPLKEIDELIDTVGDDLERALDSIPENEL